MRCPTCSAQETRVIDSRTAKNGLSIRRRRQCSRCQSRFTTLEDVVRENVVVIKADDRREEFDRRKILNGIRRACEKRPIDPEQIEMLISDIMIELESEFDLEIPSKAIGERIMTRLKAIDQIAYVRFASVYKDFRDIAELEAEIVRLHQPQEFLG